MKIFVKIASCNVIEYDIEETCTIQEIKERIEKEEKIPMSEQILIQAGKQLQDDYIIKKESLLHLVIPF